MMQLRSMKFGIGIVGAAIALPVLADMFAPSHSCYEPSKPYEFTSQWEVDQFNSEVEDYRSCINRFVEEQQEAAAAHQQAAQDAIGDWNSFVQYELN
ncbi:hypothetical protein ABWH88_12955 [Marinobacter adhaerens]|jgi:hypothetical protein|nr:hypothetical protein [Marinobacter adhaerens]